VYNTVVDVQDGARAHIGLNAHLLSLDQSYRSAGISWYIFNLLHNLGRAAPGFRFSAFLSETSFHTADLHLQRSNWPTRRPLVRIAWEQFVQPLALRRTRVDLLHALAFVAPVVTPCPFVLTIYDLSFLHYPEAFRPLNRWYLRLFTAGSAQRAQAVIAISDSTRRDVVRRLKVPPERVYTVPCGVEARFRPMPKEEVDAFRRRQGLPERFGLFLGTLEPRKNVDGLIRAYARYRKAEPAALPLVVAGGKGWFYDQLSRLVDSLDLARYVIFAGYIPEQDKVWWYNAATFFVYPSHFEGFGLPPLEAMACGVPVIASNVSSLPEVVGEAGLMIDPGDPIALAAALARLTTDTELRAALAERGLARARTFTWEKTAVETVAVYRQVLEK
jgi:glycosyltransferase involved in cell wall biosynthesis